MFLYCSIEIMSKTFVCTHNAYFPTIFRLYRDHVKRTRRRHWQLLRSRTWSVCAAQIHLHRNCNDIHHVFLMPVLDRQHSDFAWFQSRTESLPFDLTSGRSEMATTNGHGVLNAETSQLSERAEHDLPPKSYAEATVQSLEKQQEANKRLGHTNGHPDNASSTSTASNVNGFPPRQREEKQLGEDQVVYADHVDSNGTSIASVKPGPTYEEALKHNQAAAPRPRKKNTTIQGPAKGQLASGRRAGAGWERSAYACPSSQARAV
jgi:hypothetical protein